MMNAIGAKNMKLNFTFSFLHVFPEISAFGQITQHNGRGGSQAQKYSEQDYENSNYSAIKTESGYIIHEVYCADADSEYAHRRRSIHQLR